MTTSSFLAHHYYQTPCLRRKTLGSPALNRGFVQKDLPYRFLHFGSSLTYLLLPSLINSGVGSASCAMGQKSIFLMAGIMMTGGSGLDSLEGPSTNFFSNAASV
ncbi:hypothetical protein CEXT_413151 [Caerostris extrusa]|uniref:Uncharacterized protein n=1 Tax=Caerostris extrusa TaxID=172846 RepID=A0AAV4WZF8_CAEEX|nr:hypothetical protein CEXT_413151 [Caerostris extrusa]